MAAFKAKGIKVIVDIVPNHSSDDHVWFQEALKSEKGSAARERYIFRDGTLSLLPDPDPTEANVNRSWSRQVPTSNRLAEYLRR